MTNILYIAGGGALGALLRYWMSSGVHFLMGKNFPYGTLSVNLTGSILIGFLYVLLFERVEASPEWRFALIIGLLGSFTTFSTFSIETLNLFQTGQQIKAVLNILLSVGLCLTGCWLGLLAGRQL
jgi:CrcB protein